MIDELGCDLEALRTFFETIDDDLCTSLSERKRYSDRESQVIRARWYSSGAAAQYEEEGCLVPKQGVSLARHRKSRQYQEVRTAVLERDGMRCRICGNGSGGRGWHLRLYMQILP